MVTMLTIVMLTSVLSACSDNSDTDEPPEYVLTPTMISLTELSQTVGDIDNIVLGDGIMYFSAIQKNNDSLFFETFLYSVDFDENNIKNLTELHNYTPYYVPEEAMGGGVVITAMHLDDYNNLWVTELSEFFTFNLPDGFNIDDAKDDEMWEYHEELEPYYVLRKFDITGNEILSIDIENHIKDLDRTISLISDKNGYVYIRTMFTITVFNNDGEFHFQLMQQIGMIRELIRLSNGSISFTTLNEGRRVLCLIDVENGAFGDFIELPDDARDVFSGGNNYLYLFSNGESLLGIDSDKGFEIWLLDWMLSNISPNNIANMTLLSDERIVFTADVAGNTDIISLTLAPPINPDDIKILTLGIPYSDQRPGLRDVIAQFNRTSRTHRIELIDYFDYVSLNDFYGEMQRAIDRLLLDITLGRAPDILFVTDLPFYDLAAKGVFVDLYTFIDADPDISRDDLVESVFKAHEVNGGLYSIFDSFGLWTFSGLTSVVGDTPGWTMGDLKALIDENPQADLPFGRFKSKAAFLHFMINMISDDFIDFDKGTAHFDGGDFADLLVMADSIDTPGSEMLKTHAYNDTIWTGFINFEDNMEIKSSKRQLIQAEGVFSFPFFPSAIEQYSGEDYIFIGFPTESRIISRLAVNAQNTQPFIRRTLDFAITSTSNDKEGAWDFIRMVLTPEHQHRLNTIEESGSGFPTIQIALDDAISLAVNRKDFNRWDWISTEDADKLVHLIENIQGMVFISEALWGIVIESAIDYWNGQKSLEDTVHIIQNRASIYAAERGG
jgi:ABC-type glycerol-3-phosphate transport system substrate-binding protein